MPYEQHCIPLKFDPEILTNLTHDLSIFSLYWYHRYVVPLVYMGLLRVHPTMKGEVRVNNIHHHHLVRLSFCGALSAPVLPLSLFAEFSSGPSAWIQIMA